MKETFGDGTGHISNSDILLSIFGQLYFLCCSKTVPPIVLRFWDINVLFHGYRMVQ